MHQQESSMSDRIIVATFNDTNAAYDAARAIKDLKQAGAADFKLKTGVMLKKDDRGNVSLLESKDRNLLGTAVGTTTGALIGLLGGAPGVAVGGLLGGPTRLCAAAGVGAGGAALLDQGTTRLRPGGTAVLLAADE